MKDEEQELKIAYLQMIQAVIDRMSTLSAVIKGFCVTTVSGIIIASFTDVNRCGPFLALVLVFSFIILDVYYLRLERRFRALYNRVREGGHAIDFNLRPPKGRELKGDKSVSTWSCLKSPAVWLFYLPAGLVALVFVIMKFSGVE